MWQDVAAELARAPVWAQAMMGLFAVMVVVSMAGPSITRRRYRRHLAALAAACGQEVEVRSGGWPAVFSVTIDGRPFEVQHDFRMNTRSYRGPRGHLLITSTPLAGTAWSMHQVNIERADVAAVDGGLMVREDGVPARAGWLNAPTRDAVIQFIGDAPVSGPVWVQEGRLQYLMRGPWKGMDGAALKSLLERQARLAAVFERAGARPF